MKKALFLAVAVLMMVTGCKEQSPIYDITVKDMDGKDVSLANYKGKVLLIVNVASKCGLTPQYEGLEALYQKYKDQDLEILAFPCNQFLGQEPGTNDEIQSFCSLTYNVTFPLFDKIDVNGENESPLYTYLKEQSKVILKALRSLQPCLTAFTKRLARASTKAMPSVGTSASSWFPRTARPFFVSSRWSHPKCWSRLLRKC